MKLFKKQLLVFFINLLVFVGLASTISGYTTSYLEGEANTGTATLVTDINQLSSGDKIIISGYDNSATGSAIGNYSIASVQNSNNRAAQSVTVSNGNLSYDINSSEIITLGVSSTFWTFYANFSSIPGYLFSAGGTTQNYLRTRTSDSDNDSRWTISITDGIATISSQGTATRNTIKLNQTNNPTIFSSYALSSTIGLVLPSIYKVTNITTISIVDAKYFAQQIMNSTENKVNCTSDTGWSTLETDYNALSSDAKNEFKTNTTNQTIVDARERYNYLININGLLTDFVYSD